MTKPEILAPVGNKEMLLAAIRSGADAVYLGAQGFNARRNAENFDLPALKEAVKYCHTYSIKVYLTLNISVKDEELETAVSLAKQAATAGIDGIIITDLGLASVLSTVCPALPLHASTQMTVHSVSALPTLKRLGIKRVVLSRELSRNKTAELCAAAKELGIETEVFVHGALCMCMSGQCYLSAMLGGRSGNRGLCAGPCRLPFSTDGKGYDLSLKDLSLLKYAEDLRDMGVSSFKIEGRMKRPEYVAAAVNAFRLALEGKDYSAAEALLQNVFSRSGFTAGYYENIKDADMFGIRTKEDVIASGDTFSAVHELYRNERQSVALTGELKIKKGSPVSLLFSAGGCESRVYGDIPQPAVSRCVTNEDAIKNLSKLGGTPYFLNDLKTEIDDGLFVPASSLNNLRRECAEKLTDLRTEIKKPEFLPAPALPESSPHSGKPKIICRFDNKSQIPKDLSEVFAVMFPIEEAPPENLPENIIKIADIPRGINSEKAVADRLKLFADSGFTYASAGNIAAAQIAKDLNFRIFADFGLNIFNSYTADFWARNGAEFITVSPELTLKAASAIACPSEKGILAYGRLPLMISANCPVKNKVSCKECERRLSLTDRLGVKFPVRCRMGFSELLNSKPIYLGDKSDLTTAFDFLTLYFTTESLSQTQSILSAFKNGIPMRKDMTRGLYFRGVE